ncbi:hypothetical protein ScalyP_jg11194 [Parmales sp. scaly parma]|nr:hypothetical protein ScalyP_jg11194 [Parmales sp. scaly parma]
MMSARYSLNGSSRFSLSPKANLDMEVYASPPNAVLRNDSVAVPSHSHPHPHPPAKILSSVSCDHLCRWFYEFGYVPGSSYISSAIPIEEISTLYTATTTTTPMMPPSSVMPFCFPSGSLNLILVPPGGSISISPRSHVLSFTDESGAEAVAICYVVYRRVEGIDLDSAPGAIVAQRRTSWYRSLIRIWILKHAENWKLANAQKLSHQTDTNTTPENIPKTPSWNIFSTVKKTRPQQQPNTPMTAFHTPMKTPYKTPVRVRTAYKTPHKTPAKTPAELHTLSRAFTKRMDKQVSELSRKRGREAFSNMKGGGVVWGERVYVCVGLKNGIDRAGEVCGVLEGVFGQQQQQEQENRRNFDEIFMSGNWNGNTQTHAHTPSHLTPSSAISHLLTLLGPTNLLHTLHLLMLERSILLTSESPNLASNCSFALRALLSPYTWQGTFIPLLPASMVDFLSSPVPFICGMAMTKAYSHQIQNSTTFIDAHQNNGMSVIDLDGGGGGGLNITGESGVEAMLPLMSGSGSGGGDQTFELLACLCKRLEIVTAKVSIDRAREVLSSHLTKLGGSIASSALAWQKYGMMNQETSQFEFYPNWYLEPRQHELKFMESLVHTQLFVGFVDEQRKRDLEMFRGVNVEEEKAKEMIGRWLLTTFNNN